MLAIRIAINHTNWLFLPDFHSAMPFHTASQTIKGTTTHTGMFVPGKIVAMLMIKSIKVINLFI